MERFLRLMLMKWNPQPQVTDKIFDQKAVVSRQCDGFLVENFKSSGSIIERKSFGYIR
ncbi:MAG TPA: hypothetical protein VNI60_01370 [Pyrinomonadaceae bacterium]|nr:hypothetical protein [Pyrinomonadaceae bacterium]